MSGADPPPREEPNDDEDELKTFEEVLTVIHPIGNWQAYIYLMIAIIQYLFSMINTAVAFYQITPELACVIPQTSDAFRGMTLKQQLNLSAPYKLVRGEKVFDHCKYYSMNYSALPDTFEAAGEFVQQQGTKGLSECKDWVYNTTNDMSETAVTQYHLICDWKIGVEISQTVYMIGFFFGNLVSGYVADRIGRQPACVIFAVMGSIMGILLSFSPSYVWFVILRFFVSFFVTGGNISTFVMAMETTSAKWRIWVGGLFWMPYALGYTSLAGVAVLAKDWRILHVIISAPALISIAYWWLMPESPRWLLNKGRVKQAEKVIRRAAQMNGAKIPANVNFQKISDSVRQQEEESAKNAKTILLLFRCHNGKLRHPTMLLRALNLTFNWFVNASVYYGVLLNVSSFAGNRFVNNALAGAVEIPAYLICVPLLFWGRRNSLALMLGLAGVSLFIVPWVPETDWNWLRVTLAMMGKLFITSSFALVYVITGEIYPTEIRSSGMATSSCIARIGSALAPYVSSIEKFDPSLRWMTMTVFGAMSVAAGLLTLLLPETKGKRLPEYIEDAVHLENEEGPKRGAVAPASTNPPIPTIASSHL